MNEILTIIVPIYNKEKLLRECIDSFDLNRNQYEGLEILLIDDGSVDSSYNVALGYQEKFPQTIHVIHQENGGVGSVLNLGLKEAKGKYVKELDADDFISAEAIVHLLEYLYQSDVDVVLNPFRIINENRTVIENKAISCKMNQKLNCAELLKNCIPTIQMLSFKKELLLRDKFKLEPTRYYVDMQIVEEIVARAQSFICLPDYLYFYRTDQEEQSVSLKSYIKNIKSFETQTVLALARLNELIKNGRNTELIKIEFQQKNVIIYFVYLYALYLMQNEDDMMKKIMEFDTMLLKENAAVYEGMMDTSFIERIRDWNYKDEQLQRQLFIYEYQKVVRENDGIEDLSLVLHLNERKKIKKKLEQLSKMREFYKLLIKWVINKQKGIDLSVYLREQGINTVAIYGMKDLGKLLLKELEGTQVKVQYCIDKNPDLNECVVPLYKPEQDLPIVDGIIITAIHYYDDIKEELLKNGYTGKIYSLEELVDVICEEG